MKKNFSTKTFISFCFIMNIGSIYCLAQNKRSYVITRKNDTIFCEIVKPVLGKLSYKPDGQNTIVKIDPYAIKAFFNIKDRRMFEAIGTENGEELLERLENGLISLYERNASTPPTFSAPGADGMMRMSGGTSKTSIFAKKAGTVYTLKNGGTVNLNGPGRKERLKDFKNMIRDNEAALILFNRVDDFSLKTIRKVIQKYNQEGPDKLADDNIVK